jgi:hypothetical protein
MRSFGTFTVISVIKSRRALSVLHMEEIRNTYRILGRKSGEKI